MAVGSSLGGGSRKTWKSILSKKITNSSCGGQQQAARKAQQMVGMGLGAAGAQLPTRLNAVVSVVNAAGTAVAVAAGEEGGKYFRFGPQAAGMVFLYLSFGEANSWREGEESPLGELAQAGQELSLALPMTLDNLAGGAAGGLDGIQSWQAGLGSLVTCFAQMRLGFICGCVLPGGGRGHGQLVASGLFALLGTACVLNCS